MKEWLDERILLDEVPASRRAAVDAERGTPAQDARLALLRESNDDILAALPPAAVAAEVQRRARAAEATRQLPARRWVMWVAPVAAAAAVLLFVMLRGGPEMAAERFGERAKGDARLEFHRKVGDGSVRLRSGAMVAQGDQLQLSYVAAGQRYGVIVSIDGRGTVTVHHPLEGARAAELQSDGAVALRFAYELDDAPSFERFFIVTSRDPFALEIVVAAAKQLAGPARHAQVERLSLPTGLSQTSYLFRKPGATP